MRTGDDKIETQRLVLRRHEAGDLDACAQMWADPNVTRHIGGKPSSRFESWRRMLVYAGMWTYMGYGYWAAVEKQTGKYVGELGFADFKRQIEPPLDGIPELGFALVSSAHGKGFATEAVRAVLAWGDAHLTSRRTVCMIDPGNVPSVRVAQKAGYREYLHTTYMGGTTVLFERITA